MVLRILFLIASSAAVGGLVYFACVFWPLSLLQPTGLIAATGAAMAWLLVLAVYLDGRSADRSGPQS